MNADLLLTPPLAFLAFLLVSYGVDALGRHLADDRTGDGEFRRAYACGEDIAGERVTPSYNLYNVGIGFTVLHLAVLLVATLPVSRDAAVLGVALLGVVFVSLLAVLRSGVKP